MRLGRVGKVNNPRSIAIGSLPAGYLDPGFDSPVPEEAISPDLGLPEGRIEQTAGANSKTLTIVLPALNEEEGIVDVLSRVPQNSLRQLGIDVQMILLDGRSTDSTRDKALQNGARVFIQRGRGKGSAMRELLPTLTSDYCIVLDSDGSYPPEVLPTLVKELLAGKPVVIGSRFRGNIQKGAMAETNRLGNRFLTELASLLYQVRASDVCSGMWGYLTATSFDIEANFFAECSLHGVPLTEIPITYGRRIGTPKLRLRAGFKIAWILLVKRLRAAS